MAFDADVASDTATSYLEVTDADTLATDDYGPERESWLDAGEFDKERALMRATIEIDAATRSSYARYSSVQSLRFPRTIDYTLAPVTPYIPAAILRATYYQAAYLIRNAKVIAAADTRRARDMQSASEPNVSYTRSYQGRDETETPVLSVRALHELEGYRVEGLARGVRSIIVASPWASST